LTCSEIVILIVLVLKSPIVLPSPPTRRGGLCGAEEE
jgi:hypothetical protein